MKGLYPSTVNVNGVSVVEGGGGGGGVMVLILIERMLTYPPFGRLLTVKKPYAHWMFQTRY